MLLRKPWCGTVRAHRRTVGVQRFRCRAPHAAASSTEVITFPSEESMSHPLNRFLQTKNEPHRYPTAKGLAWSIICRH
uniref:Uncharacterized protein n=1 Tax=Anguilla anguilla TaxID=7936 RepID=A0A0E9S3P9_ANGAN